MAGAADPGPPDAELLSRYTDTSDPDAFAALVRRHGRTVLGACRRVLADPHAAEDAFQATFLQLARTARGLRTPAALVAWLHRTARRTALRHRRSAPPADPADRPSPAPSPLDALTARELLAAIEDEIDRLPEAYRPPLVLYYLDGLSKAAAADRLGLSPEVLRGRLDRGRDRLRTALARRGLAPGVVLGLLVPTAGPASADLVGRTVGVCARGQPMSATIAALAAARSATVGKAALAAGLVAVVGGLGLLAAAGPGDPPPPPGASRPADPQPRTDIHGDPLPPHALARIGTLRWRHHEEGGNQLHVVPSPTGRLVATAAVGTKVIRVFDMAAGRPLCEIPWQDWAGYEVRFTPDGSRVFHLAGRGVVRSFDPISGRLVGETKPVVETDVPHRVRGAEDGPESFNTRWTEHSLTTDGRWVLTTHPVDGEFTLLLTEVTGAAKRRQVRLELPGGFKTGVEVYAYVRVGDTLIGAGRDWAKGRRGPLVLRWDLSTGKVTKTTRIVTRESGFDLSADGTRLVTYRGPGVRVWDTETGAEAVRLEEPTDAGYGTRFSPDGKRVVGVVSNPTDETTAIVTIWELDGGKIVGLVRVPRRYDNPYLLADGRTLLVAGRGLMVSTWDIATGRRLSPAGGHEDHIGCLAFSADGKTLFTSSRDRNETITSWDPRTGRKIRDLAAPGGSSRFVLTAGGAVVTATADGTLVWADAMTGREVRRIDPGALASDLGGSASAIELSPGLDPRTGRPAVCGLIPAAQGGRTLLARWDAGTGEPLARRAFPGGTFDRFRAVSPDGRLVARETADPPAKGQSGPKGDGVGLAEMLGRQAVVLEDTTTGASVLRLPQPDFLQGGSIALTWDSRTLVTWTSTYPTRGPSGTPPGATTVRLWELRSGKERLVFRLPVIGRWWEFEPHAVALSADGRFLAGARPDKTIIVWDLTTGKEVAMRTGFGTRCDSLTFRADGNALASGHADGTALVWDLSAITPARPPAIDREAAWKDLAAGDAPRAYRAILALAADPGCAAFLRDRVKPAAAPPAEQIGRLTADLDSPTFATRERATADLTKLGDAADDPLRSALKRALSAEQRRRIEGILAGRGLTEPDPDRLRALRCVEALERFASATARALLAELANGAPGARLTQESADALRRLADAAR